MKLRQHFLSFCLALLLIIFVSANSQSVANSLIDAVKTGNLELVVNSIKNGADVNATDSDGYTALMSAAFGGHPEVAKLLINNGADVNATDSDGHTRVNVSCLWRSSRSCEIIDKKRSRCECNG